MATYIHNHVKHTFKSIQTSVQRLNKSVQIRPVNNKINLYQVTTWAKRIRYYYIAIFRINYTQPFRYLHRETESSRHIEIRNLHKYFIFTFVFFSFSFSIFLYWIVLFVIESKTLQTKPMRISIVTIVLRKYLLILSINVEHTNTSTTKNKRWSVQKNTCFNWCWHLRNI